MYIEQLNNSLFPRHQLKKGDVKGSIEDLIAKTHQVLQKKISRGKEGSSASKTPARFPTGDESDSSSSSEDSSESEEDEFQVYNLA
jgi:hypothetical protein